MVWRKVDVMVYWKVDESAGKMVFPLVVAMVSTKVAELDYLMADLLAGDWVSLSAKLMVDLKAWILDCALVVQSAYVKAVQ